jgi:hypothetical protein
LLSGDELAVVPLEGHPVSTSRGEAARGRSTSPGLRKSPELMMFFPQLLVMFQYTRLESGSVLR